MRAGILTEQVQILRVKVIHNEYGEQRDIYKPWCTTRANITPVSGARTDENYEVFYEHRYKFVVRLYVDVNDFDRILWNGKQYRIINIDENKRQNNKTIITELVNL